MASAITKGESAKAYSILKAMDMFGRIKGKKALQKILYFVNLEQKIFLYQWSSYGPYSEEAKCMLDDMVISRHIHMEERDLDDGGMARFDMELTEDGRSRLGSIGQMPEIDSRLGFVRRLLGGKSPREMELLASAYYIVSYDDGAYSGRTFDIISKLKPNANFSQGDVDGAVRELESHGLLDPSVRKNTRD